MSFLYVDSLSAQYPKQDAPVLREVSLSAERGQVTALIGPSGSGKSTLLRVLVGLLAPSGGRVMLDGTVLDYGSRAALQAARKRFAIVFQQFNLFQNMTALRNVIAAPLLVQGRKRDEAEAEGAALLARVGLGEKLNAYPDELSGGQQQRVALARALALKPEVLLLDEVTSALDPELVGEVLSAIRNLKNDGMTMLIVSHEMAFVREVADEVVFMDRGGIVERGPPARLFDSPSTDRMREFAARILRHT